MCPTKQIKEAIGNMKKGHLSPSCFGFFNGLPSWLNKVSSNLVLKESQLPAYTISIKLISSVKQVRRKLISFPRVFQEYYYFYLSRNDTCIITIYVLKIAIYTFSGSLKCRRITVRSKLEDRVVEITPLQKCQKILTVVKTMFWQNRH